MRMRPEFFGITRDYAQEARDKYKERDRKRLKKRVRSLNENNEVEENEEIVENARHGGGGPSAPNQAYIEE